MLHLARCEVAYRGGVRFHVAEGEACLVGSALMRDGVAVYPNPAADVAYVESGSAMGNIAVYSLSGQKVLAANAAGERRVALEVGNLQSGVYVVKIATEDGEVVSRLIKK